MGRAVLIVVLLVSAIYSGVVMNLQKKMLKIPEVLVKNVLQKHAENLSDYALRTAVRDASTMGLNIPNLGYVDVTRRYTNFKVESCQIDSIRYRFVSDKQHFQAITYVTGNLQGVRISYPAEIAFSFPVMYTVRTPDLGYYQMDQPQFHGANEYIRDDSPFQHYGIPMNAIGTRPMGYGVDGWKCANFDGVNDYIRIPDAAHLRIDSTFTLSCFAKIVTTVNTATLMWIPSNPYDTNVPAGGNPGQNLRYKPTAGIWYTKSDGRLHYGVTTNNGELMDLGVPYTPVGKWPYNKDAWHHFALTFNRGVLKAYINGVCRGTMTSPVKKTMKSLHGFTLGRRDILVFGTPVADFYYLLGVMDQVGLFSYALTDEEIYNLYWGIIKQASILYIRD